MSATDHLMPKQRRSLSGPAIAVALVAALHVGLYFAWGVIGKIVIPKFPPLFVHVVPATEPGQALPALPVQIHVPAAPALRRPVPAKP